MKQEFSSPFEMIPVGLDKQVMKPYKQGTALFAGLKSTGTVSPFLGSFFRITSNAGAVPINIIFNMQSLGLQRKTGC